MLCSSFLLDSGLGLTKAISTYNSLISGKAELEKLVGFCVAPLGYFRGTELAYYGFLCDFTLKVIEDVRKPLSNK